MTDSLDKFFGGSEGRQERSPAPAKAKRHPYCKKHGSYFCPCVRPEMYRAGDKRGDPKAWDEAQEKRREKAQAQRDEAHAEYLARQENDDQTTD